jgi:hypothetical protein
MSLGTSKTFLVLDGAAPPPSVDGAGSYTLRHAASALEAAALMAKLRPALILVRPDLAWHRTFVETLPPSRRPAVVAVGQGPVHAGFVDEWLGGAPTPEEIPLRLQLAEERACERRHSARRAFVDPLTGLPNRRAVVHALIG